jgi:hypothetical protein
MPFKVRHRDKDIFEKRSNLAGLELVWQMPKFCTFNLRLLLSVGIASCNARPLSEQSTPWWNSSYFELRACRVILLRGQLCGVRSLMTVLLPLMKWNLPTWRCQDLRLSKIYNHRLLLLDGWLCLYSATKTTSISPFSVRISVKSQALVLSS